ncbi:glutamine amidotransferase [Spongisporangium articulatum]|uniref:Glutamine amidotransferase n=1 Tax=Spongisporangium articulatum TaxID=3362603 RepID=A0ABW8AQV5_9ACTN
MKPFLLLATRAEDAVADSEYRQFLRFGSLEPEQLVRVRLESAPLGDLLPGLDLTRYSGVIVGGSPFTSSDPAAEKSPVQHRVERELAALLDDILKLDIPFLGACYGIATLGLHQGGVVDTTYPEEASAVEITLTEDGRRDPLLAGLPETFLAYVGHKEALRETPPGATLLATGAACPVQMFRVGTRQYATQFHPELDVPGIVERILAYQHLGYFVPETIDVLIEAVSAAEVVHPARLVANFVELFAE